MDEMHYQMDLLTAMNQKLLGNDKMFRMICGTSSNAFLYYDYAADRFETLGCWERYFHFRLENDNDLNKLMEQVKEEYQAELEEVLHCERAQQTVRTVKCEMTEQKRWLEFEVTVTYDEHTRPSEKVIRIRDITKSKEQMEELQYLAYYDALTGLYNRNYFVRLLSEWVRKAKVEQHCIDVMYIRVNEFRKLNESLGMIAGDELLQSFGLFLRDFQSEDLIISHFNEDIYCMAIYNSYADRSTEYYYELIVQKLQKPILLMDNNEVRMTVSCGVSRFPESARNSLELINMAEIVLSHERGSNRNSIQYFEAPMLADFMENINMENQLKSAIEDQDFELYYQPQYDAVTKEMRGVEALIRWRGNDGKFVSPAVFIPLAEKDGLIIQIGNWVLEEALRTLSLWDQKYETQLIMSINISAIQYKKADFVQHLMSLIEKYQVNPEMIELEITETVLIDNQESVVEKLNVLKEYGIKISLDDFGTGYSSLSYLKGLPIDTLKIDKSFIDTVICDSSTRVITESIIAMVKKLGCETVAEGVETIEQLSYLQAIKCDHIQGFLLGKPMPGKEIELLLEKMDGRAC